MRLPQKAACLIALALVLAGCASPPTRPAAPSAGARPLRILLVNDDGWDAPGITVLRQELMAAGHQVTVVGPAGPESGSGGALTITGPPLQLVERQPGVWSVSGHPADATLIGLRTVLASSPPELVISGINSDYNLGSTTVHSGTVGAALAAAELGVPAIAASTKVADSARPTAADYGPSADYMVRLVNALSARSDRSVAPGSILNINYPKGGVRAAGVVAVGVAGTPQMGVTYTQVAPGQFVARVEPVAPPDPQAMSDIAAVARHQVSVSALALDFATGPEAQEAATAAAGATGP